MSERRIASSSSRLHGDRNKLSSNLHGQNLETVLELDGETLESILKLVVGRLRDAIQSTVENIPSNEKQDRCFLSNGDLERIIDSRLLARLLKALVTDSNFVNFQEGGHEEPQRNNRDALIVNEVVDRYIAMTISRKKLLALVLYQESQELLVLFMQWLKYHGDDAPSDDSIPFSSVSLDHLGVLGRLQHNIICDQNIFTPITVLQSEDLKIGTQDRLPFIAGKKDFTKFSSGTVCEVTIAQRHFAIKDGRRMMTANPDGAKAIALKLFNDKQHMDEVTISFQTELNILRDIRRFNMKQKAIMLDWGSLTVVDDVGNPISHYLMFESATFSLTSFLHSGACAQTWITGGRSLLLAKFGDIVDALAFLHDSLKTVHLDIKPDNIIISGHEASRSLSKAHNDNNLIWRLSNFGLARKLGASQRLGHNASKLLSDPSTVSDKQPVGTYQGPEIYEGELGRASYSSDVWSIGCVALQVLAFISGGPFEVSKLHDCLATEYFDRKGRLTLFYVRNDTHAWRNGDVSHYRYQYLKDYYPVTGQIPDTQVQAAVNPQVIHWSNKLHRSYEGYAEQRFIRQYLEQIFCSVLLINSSKRVGADHLSKALQVIQSRWKLFEDNPVDYFHYQRSIESSEISDTHKQSVPLVNTVEPSKPYRTRTVARRWRSSYKHVSIFDNATIRGPQISNLYPAIESNDATTARSELERDVGQLQRYCLGSSRYPVHCAIHLKAYEVLTVLLEFSDAETANLVCEGRTALELACDGGGDARALGVIKQYQHKFDFPGGVYERYRGALNTDVRNVLDDLFGTSSAGKEKEVSRPNDATSDIDQGLAPPSLQELSPPDKTSIDNKDSTSEAQVNTQLLQTEFIESFDKHGRSFASVNREVDSLPESSVKSSAPLTISKKGIIKPVNDELGGELIFQATQKNLSCLRQVKTSLPNFTLPPSLPLLVDKALRYLPIPHIEPSIPEGKIRVRWISVGSIICCRCSMLTYVTGRQTQIR
jgi:serine/threonine protein kinase